MFWIENRAYCRAGIDLEVELDSERGPYRGIISDIGEGGLFIATAVPPRVGERLELSLELPGEPSPLAVRGVVRWVRDPGEACEGAPPGFGMEWLMLSADGLRAIKRFVISPDQDLHDAA